jgi:ABC-type transport system involved in cytochrome bd biosynthesis fused ATPase/permease subunit
MKPLDPRLLRYARRARWPITLLAALGAVAAGLVIIQAQFLATAIAGAFTGHDGLAELRVPVIGLAVVIAARAVTAWATHATSHRASAAATAQLRQRLLARAVELGPSWLAGRRTAELAELATRGLDDLDGYFTSYLPALVLAAIVPVAVLARVAAADPWSALTIALTLPLVPLFGALIGMATARHADRRWRSLATLAHHFLDVVTGLPTLKVFGRARAQLSPGGVPDAAPRSSPRLEEGDPPEPPVRARWKGEDAGRAASAPGTLSSVGRVTEEYRRATMATLRLAFLSALALELIATTSVALVAVEIGLRLASGHLDLRTGLLALILAPEAYLPLRNAGAQFHATADGLAAATEVFAILEAPAPAREPDARPGPGPGGALAAPGLDGLSIRSIIVENVSVRHEGRGVPAPDGMSLTIRPGRLTVLAGPSGCGKSTLIAALLGFTRPDEGRIVITARNGSSVEESILMRKDSATTVDNSKISCPITAGTGRQAGLGGAGPSGTDLREADLDWWRSLIGWVPQEPTLFPGTVADNIRLGWPQAPDSAVLAAATAAALDDVPLDTVLADRGAGLSAGQRRRVALARALLPRPRAAAGPAASHAAPGPEGRDCGSPQVLLLDEPTAGLDPAAEARVIATLHAEAARGRAILVVSHHPAVLVAADEVVHMTARRGPAAPRPDFARFRTGQTAQSDEQDGRRACEV